MCEAVEERIANYLMHCWSWQWDKGYSAVKLGGGTSACCTAALASIDLVLDRLQL